MSRWTAPMSALVGGMSRTARREIEKKISNDSPVPLAPRRTSSALFSGMSTQGSVLSQLEMYAGDPVIRPIVSRLQQSVSEADWHLYVKSRTGDKQDRTEVTDHAVLDLLARPNAFQTFPEVVARGQQHWELVGETNIVLGFLPGVKYPLDMWVLRPDRITPVPDPYAFLKGWMYSAPGDNQDIPLDLIELMRMVDPDPTDPYRGLGAVASLMRDLGVDHSAKQWQNEFFANSAQPGGMLISDHHLNDDEWTETQERWAEQHKGVSKAHRVAIMENMTWQPNTVSLRDLQMVEMDALGRDKTLAAFGMPKSMIGVVEDVNRANAEAGVFMFARWMTKPRLTNWRSMLNSKLLPFFDPNGMLELDYDDPVPENSDANIAELKTKADVVAELVKAGFEADDVLDLVDWPTMRYQAPPAPTVVAPPGAPAPNADEPVEGDDIPDEGTQLRTRIRIDDAMRWVARGHPDDNCCTPCKDNLATDDHPAKTYRNRQAAYADYPPGEGYIKCIGRQYGNKCRCHVAKRRSGRDE